MSQKHGPNRAALEEQVEAMSTGREHRALVEACRALADRVDYLGEIGAFDDKAWREYRLALRGLQEAISDVDDDSFESLAESLRTKVSDAEDS